MCTHSHRGREGVSPTPGRQWDPELGPPVRFSSQHTDWDPASILIDELEKCYCIKGRPYVIQVLVLMQSEDRVLQINARVLARAPHHFSQGLALEANHVSTKSGTKLAKVSQLPPGAQKSHSCDSPSRLGAGSPLSQRREP